MSRQTAVLAICLAAVAGLFIGSQLHSSAPGDASVAAAPAPSPPPPTPSRPIAGAEGGRPSGVDRRPAVPAENPDAVYKVPVAAGEPTRGPDDALVTIVEWTDFQCPFCSRVQTTLRQIEGRYGDRVRLVVRMNPLPFHADALPAAEAAMAAHAQGKFWPMHDRLFESQRSLNRETFEQIAQQIGLDMGRFRRDLDQHVHRASIEQQQRAGAALGARGTPTFFVNGRKLRGAQPLDRFQVAIDGALANAQSAMRQHRLAASQIYDFLIRDGATSPVLLAGTPRPTR